MSRRPLSLTVAAAVAVIFGLLTIVSGGRALFGGVDMGAVVPFVLWFNFVAGFAYVLTGIGLWRGAGWAPMLSLPSPRPRRWPSSPPSCGMSVPAAHGRHAPWAR